LPWFQQFRHAALLDEWERWRLSGARLEDAARERERLWREKFEAARSRTAGLGVWGWCGGGVEGEARTNGGRG
jgi:hypothetical protein